MKRLYAILILLAVCLCSSAESYRVAMTKPHKGYGKVDDFDVATLSAALEKAIGRSGEYKIVARGAGIDILMKDFDFEAQGVLTKSEQARLVSIGNVDFICMSSVDCKNGKYLIRAKFIDKNSGEYSNIVSSWVSDWDRIYQECENLASELTEMTNNREEDGEHKGFDYTERAYGMDMKMIFVQGGEFLMGGTSEQGDDADDDEQVIRRVTLGDFCIGQFEVTQAQWEAVMGTSLVQQRNKANRSWPLCGKGPKYPIYYVNWEEASEFCRILSNKTGRNYRLPTEAEWEYAARGGQKSGRTRYSGSNMVEYVAWFSGNSGKTVHPVGGRNANELDIYDMSGNVREWCYDWYADVYDETLTDNPTGPSDGVGRVLRGGSWNDYAGYCRVSYRRSNTPDCRYNFYGFRVVCVQ